MSAPPLVCFDVDGTLADTRELNRRAYADVGISIPDHAWGLPWHQWLPGLCGSTERARQVHARKIVRYTTILQEVPAHQVALPPAHVARLLEARSGEVNTVMYATAGHRRTARRVRDKLGLLGPLAPLLTYDERARTLQSNRVVVYVDDNRDTLVRLARDIPRLRTVHYDDQDADTLLATVNHLAALAAVGGRR